EPLIKPRPSIRYTRHVGGWRNADPLYAFPERRVVAHFVPDSPLRTSALRTLGGYGNVFAIESFMDELAEAAGVDPVEFRLRHLDDPRAIAVIEAAAAKANWQPGGASPGAGRGRGFAFSQYKNIQCYTAIVVDISVDKATGAIKLERAVIAADAGQVVNPDGLSNQLEGGFVQGASWALYEGVHYEQKGIMSLDWESYPILRFDNAPYLETVILNRPDQHRDKTLISQRPFLTQCYDARRKVGIGLIEARVLAVTLGKFRHAGRVIRVIADECAFHGWGQPGHCQRGLFALDQASDRDGAGG
ncbi:MAG: xanthine dehydrogenase family protein molybdopterin-binding subunit, partial [Anaerolineales bacterium]|nr:xanthine dehydrogenase family protein molybdopterin-binding subunit [Anaerolineales bacterium]